MASRRKKEKATKQSITTDKNIEQPPFWVCWGSQIGTGGKERTTLVYNPAMKLPAFKT